jgi:primosomal protein N''
MHGKVTTTWDLRNIDPSPHVLDLEQTEAAAEAYALRDLQSVHHIEQRIADMKRAVEHEQACIRGYERARRLRGRG